MCKTLRILLLGIVVWAVPFALGIALMQVVDVESALFDTLVSVTMAFSATQFAYVHLSRCAIPTLDEGLMAGTIWMMMAIALDVPLYFFGPEEARMAPIDYIAMIPIIAATIGRALRRT